MTGRRHGFTLIELLTAVALMSLLAASLYTSLYTAFRARRSARESLDPLQTAASALELLARDLRSAVPPGGLLAGSFLGDAGDPRSGWGGRVPASRAADLGLQFHRLGEAGQEREGQGDIRRVHWRLEAGDNGAAGRLLRTCLTELLAPEEPEGREDVVCRGVRALTWSFFDGQDWLETWDSEAQGQALPRAVTASIELEGAAGAPGAKLERVFHMPMAAMPAHTVILR